MKASRYLNELIDDIEAGAEMTDLSSWECDFLSDIMPTCRANEWVSDKQIAIIERIHNKVMGEN